MHWPINVVTMVRGVGVRTKIVTQGLIPFQTYYRHTQTSVLPTPQKAQPQPSLLSIQAPAKHQSATQLSCTAARVRGMQNSQLLIWWSFWKGYVCSLRKRHCQLVPSATRSIQLTICFCKTKACREVCRFSAPFVHRARLKIRRNNACILRYWKHHIAYLMGSRKSVRCCTAAQGYPAQYTASPPKS